MPSYYFYKMTVDDGGAPCVEHGLLSLAICKPGIRSSAVEGDFIIGFAANSLSRDNRLIYIAKINEPKLINGDYFKPGQYRNRSDCIYDWNNGKFHVQPAGKYHGSLSDLLHDLGEPPKYEKANTLLSTQFCYFGCKGNADYKKLFPAVKEAVESLKQGHRLNHSEKLASELKTMVETCCALNDPCELGKPTQKPKRGVNHRGGASGYC